MSTVRLGSEWRRIWACCIGTSFLSSRVAVVFLKSWNVRLLQVAQRRAREVDNPARTSAIGVAASIFPARLRVAVLRRRRPVRRPHSAATGAIAALRALSSTLPPPDFAGLFFLSLLNEFLAASGGSTSRGML